MHKKAVIQYTVLVYCIIRIHCYWSKNCSVFPTPALILSRFLQPGAVCILFSWCCMSKVQPSLSAHAVKSSIRMSHLTPKVPRHHFSSLDESSLVPFKSILNIA